MTDKPLTPAEEWLLDIGRAAQERGYGVRRIGVRRIDLVPLKGKGSEVSLRGFLVSGPEIRRTLRSIREPAP